MDLTCEPITLNVKRSIPLGLIVKELVINALKYVFPEGREGKVKVVLQRDPNEIELQVIDNSVGTREGFDIQKSTGIGMQVVSLLSQQLRGRIE